VADLADRLFLGRALVGSHGSTSCEDTVGRQFDAGERWPAGCWAAVRKYEGFCGNRVVLVCGAGGGPVERWAKGGARRSESVE
jgi:hypothetical protein